MTKVRGRCPACRNQNLILTEDGIVFCWQLGCRAPGTVDDWLHEEPIPQPPQASDSQSVETDIEPTGTTALERRLRLALQSRRAREHQLDGIRRALCDVGLIKEFDPSSYADLEDAIRRALGGSADDQPSAPDGSEPPVVGHARVAVEPSAPQQGSMYSPDPTTRSGPHDVTIHNPRGRIDLEPGFDAPGATYLAGRSGSRLLLDGVELCVASSRPVIIEPFSEGVHGGLMTLTLVYHSVETTADATGEEVSDV
ncbi:hypothetical protein [Streptomyces sp. NPDC047097]|uniref:hypothetical protein n=1 Tax=Streptomyces sp. NPDC047097 TaxID=3155260 RepID=UPI0033CF666E